VAAQAARDMDAAAIAVFTQSGGTAVVVSKYRPLTPIFAFTPVEEVERRLAIVWGIQPRRVKPLRTTDRMVEVVETQLRAERAVKRGDLVVMIAGTPVAVPGSTNFMKIHTVGV
jgi:pyruvate kinase